jgi:hypothetical protein
MYKSLAKTCCSTLALVPHPLGCLGSSSLMLTTMNAFCTTKLLAIRFKEFFPVFRASPLPTETLQRTRS